MATANDFRRLALALPGAAEGAHADHPDFRVGGKIFASLAGDGRAGHVRIPPTLLALLVKREPSKFSGAGGWAKQGWMRVDLAGVTAAELADLLAGAHAHRIAPPTGTRPRKRAE